MDGLYANDRYHGICFPDHENKTDMIACIFFLFLISGMYRLQICLYLLIMPSFGFNLWKSLMLIYQYFSLDFEAEVLEWLLEQYITN